MRIEWVIASVVGSAFMGSALITPLYAVYQKAFGFSEITLTLIYAAYVLGNLGALLFLGNLSDRIGRRPLALGSVAVGCCAMLLFLFARGTMWLVLARVLSGIAVGMATGTGAAWLSDLTEDKNHATIVTNAANAFGFALGPLLAGSLVQWAPFPRQLPFYVYLPLLVIVGLLVARSPESVKNPKPVTPELVRPRLGVPAEIRARFIAPAVTSFGTFGLVGFYAGLIPTTLARDLHQPSPALAGAIVFEMACLAGAFTFVSGRIEKRAGMLSALLLLVPAAALLVLAQWLHSLSLLIVATAIGAACWGLGIRGSLQVVNEIAPADRRAEVASVYYLAGFAGNSIPVIGVGVLTAITTPLTASLTFACTIAAFAIAAFAMDLARSATRPPDFVRTRS